MHLLDLLLLLCGVILPHHQEELHQFFACMLKYVAYACGYWLPRSIPDMLACTHGSPNLGAVWQMCAGRCFHPLTCAPPALILQCPELDLVGESISCHLQSIGKASMEFL